MIIKKPTPEQDDDENEERRDLGERKVWCSEQRGKWVGQLSYVDEKMGKHH